MAIFNSYVKLPEGTKWCKQSLRPQKCLENKKNNKLLHFQSLSSDIRCIYNHTILSMENINHIYNVACEPACWTSISATNMAAFTSAQKRSDRLEDKRIEFKHVQTKTFKSHWLPNWYRILDSKSGICCTTATTLIVTIHFRDVTKACYLLIGDRFPIDTNALSSIFN